VVGQTKEVIVCYELESSINRIPKEFAKSVLHLFITPTALRIKAQLAIGIREGWKKRGDASKVECGVR
jgi:hypothetical protein